MNVLKKRKKRETLSKKSGEDEECEEKRKRFAFKYIQEVNEEERYIERGLVESSESAVSRHDVVRRGESHGMCCG